MTSQPAGAGNDRDESPASGEGTWCCALELAGERRVDAPVPFTGQRRARVLVRVHGEPLGYLTVPTGPGGPHLSAVSQVALARFGQEVAAHLRSEGLAGDIPMAGDGPLPGPGPSCPNAVESDALVSVVVCTRDRSEILAGCLDGLRALTHPRLEMVIVDNAPSDERARDLVEAVARTDPRFRYVREPRPGLSRARNAGLAAARGTYVAFTDDDVTVDPGWVQGLLRGFRRRDDVGCVTGMVCTAGINGPAEEYFDARAAAWSGRFGPGVFGPDDGDLDPLYPYRPSLFGTGANCAVDRRFFAGLGGFDEALGAGTRSLGGEDLDAFVRVLRAGRAIAYEPSAIVWHRHRADRSALMRQMYGYGTGLTAFLTKNLLQPATRADVLRRVPSGLRRIAGIGRGTAERLAASAEGGAATAVRPGGVLVREWLGLLAGPGLYIRARADARRQR